MQLPIFNIEVQYMDGSKQRRSVQGTFGMVSFDASDLFPNRHLIRQYEVWLDGADRRKGFVKQLR